MIFMRKYLTEEERLWLPLVTTRMMPAIRRTACQYHNRANTCMRLLLRAVVSRDLQGVTGGDT